MTPHVLCIGGEDHHLRIPFLERLRAKGFVVTAAGTAASSLFAQTKIDYHQIEFSRFVSPWSDWKSVKSLERLVRTVQPDLVQCFDTKPCILAPLAVRGMPEVSVVCTVNGLGRVYSSFAPGALVLRPVLEFAYRAAAGATTLTVFQNREDQAFFRKKRMIGQDGDKVIPGSGVDIDAFDTAATDSSRGDLRSALGLDGAEIVMSVARMTREKGIPTLLEAADMLHRRRPGVKFLLVGPFETEGRFAVSRAEIERRAPYVMALGPRKDVPALLKIADVFVLPTELREGVPRTLLEAAAAGCPIVTTRMPGCTDVVQDGWSGYLVPPRSPKPLAHRILDHLEDPRAAKAMGARAAEFVRREFNLEVTVERYVAAYDSLLRRSDRRGTALDAHATFVFANRARDRSSDGLGSCRARPAEYDACMASSVRDGGTIRRQ